MKIQLERRLVSCPDTIQCTVCARPFAVDAIRSLLYGDRGWLKGDVCPHCLHLSTDAFKQNLWTQAMHLRGSSAGCHSHRRRRHQESLECLELSQEDLHGPTWWHWWLKRWEIFAQESQELEADRVGREADRCEQRSRLEKLLRY
jgi:hypothetical protein